mmetsp:Transcript_15456/g.36470  ORF Transcript_15456/g.36470 Transcript_15456/m.36470 type:complete len:332 (+) Transcript_15456:34-1029(+)
MGTRLNRRAGAGASGMAGRSLAVRLRPQAVQERQDGEDQEAQGGRAHDQPLAQLRPGDEGGHHHRGDRQHQEGQGRAHEHGDHRQRGVQADHGHLRAVAPLSYEDCKEALRHERGRALGRLRLLLGVQAGAGRGGRLVADGLGRLLPASLDEVGVGLRAVPVLRVEQREEEEEAGSDEVQDAWLQELREAEAEQGREHAVQQEPCVAASERDAPAHFQSQDQGHEPGLVEELRDADHKEGLQEAVRPLALLALRTLALLLLRSLVPRRQLWREVCHGAGARPDAGGRRNGRRGACLRAGPDNMGLEGTGAVYERRAARDEEGQRQVAEDRH